MALYTNTGLVKHAENALGQKTVYMWGGILRLVEKQYDLLYSIYGNTPGTGYTPERWAYLKSLFGKGYYGCDCVGLIKSYYWSGKADGGTGSPDYGKYPKLYPDVDANTMYSKAKVKGKIAELPETPGIILISRKAGNHVGVYIGGGETIESTLGSRGDGVVRHKLDKNFWTDWFECPYIGYVDPPIRTGDNVTIKESATTYAGVSTKIPDGLKGSKQVYTVLKVLGDKALLKELYSWVWIRDLEVNHILGRGGPDGELGASLRYLSQRFAQTDKSGIALLTDIGTEELGHLEMIGSIVTQLTKGEGAKSFDRYGVGDYYIDHANAVYPASASGVPFTAAYLQSKGDPIADIMEDMAAEQKARATYDNILRMSDDPDVTNVIRYLREREVVHFQRFGELLDRLQSKIQK